MICPSCGTGNRHDAMFCKYCGFDLAKAPRPAAAQPPAPPPTPSAMPPPPPMAPPPAPMKPRVWWHGLGVFVIVAAFLLFIDLATTARVTWSIAAVLSLAFLIGMIMILQFLASPDRRDRRPFAAGAALLLAAVLLLPVALVFQSSPTTTQTLPSVPFNPAVQKVDLVVSNDAGEISVAFAAGMPYLVRAEVVHQGGLFSSHYDGDVAATNATAGDTLTYTINAHGIAALFFAGGHKVSVTLHKDLAASLSLVSTTGNVYVDIPSGVEIREVETTVTTGNVNFLSANAVFMDDATVKGTSTTGNIHIEIGQTTAVPATVDVFGTSTTGNVVLEITRGPDVAARVDSSVTTGSIGFDQTKYQGTTALLYGPSQAMYESLATVMKFNAVLRTTTGSIDIR